MTRGTRFNRRSSLFRWLAAVAILATACAVLALAHTWTTSRAQGGELRFGEPLDAVLAPGGVDDWFFAANEGDIVALRVERTDGDLEPALLVSDADGQPIAGTQAAPVTASAALVQVRLPRAGSFVVQVSGAGQTAGAYRLSLDRTQAGPPAATLAPEIAQESAAGAITPGQSVQGEIDDDVFRQLWTLPGQTGDVLDIRVTALSGDLDPFVALLAPGGDVLATNDSADGGRDAGLLAFQLPFNGEYTVVARRAGDAAGRAGVTRGTYRLDVARRNPGDATRNTQLGFGERVRGRLDDAFPVAVYRLEIGGSLALRLDLGSANRLARLRFLSATGDVIAERTGLSPLLASARLEGRGPFLVEVSAQTFDGAPFVDYAVTAFRLSAGVASARPLDDDAPQTWTANGPQTWFFAAEAGDLARLTVTPEGLPSAGVTVVRVRAPGDVILYQGDLTPGIDQELALPSSGLYEIEVRPPEGAASTFRLNLAREGGRGAPFAPFAAAAVDLGPLQPGAPVDATLAPGAVDARWIDAAAGQVITLTATAESDSDIIGLGLQRPDGDFLRVQLSQPDRIALLARVEVPETGRYRAVVFGDPAHILTPAADARPIRYTLRYDQAGGGSLQSGAPVKDFVAPEDGLSVWRLEASGGALLNVRAENLTPAIWSPTLTLLAPGGGALAATSAPTGQGATLEVLGVEAPVSGVYQVVMAGGIIRGQIASYTLQAEVQEPFAPDIAPRVLVAATRLPVDLFEPAAPAEPVRVSIPALLNSPISPTQTGELVHILPFDATTRGEMDAGEAGQTWRFTVGSGLALQVRATSLTRHAGPSLALWDQNGGLVFEQHSAEDPETLMIVRLPQGGTYDLVVSMGLEGGRYLLSLEALDIATGNLQALAGAPLVYGQSAAGESLRPEDEAAYYFFGETGDPVRAQLVRTTGDFVPSLELIGPTGNALAQAQSADGLSAATIDGVRLPTAGVYALRVRNLSASEGGAGRYALYLTLAGDTRLDNRGGGVLRRGETVRGQLGPGDNDDTWLLAGRAGERITLEAVGVDALTPLTLRLADTAGRSFAVRETSFAQTPARITSLLLPADGIYRVQVSGGARAAGLYSLTWGAEAARLEPGPLRYGQTVTGLFSNERLSDTWTFAATAGDVVSIAVRYLRGDPFIGSFQLRSADGLPLATVGDAGDGRGARADVLLPFSGSYSIVVGNVDPAFQGAGVYALSLNLRESHARSAGAVIAYGQTAAGEIYSDDAEDSWVFGARAGDQVRISVTPRDRFLRPLVELRSAAGELLAQSTAELDRGSEAAIGAGAPDAALAIPADDVYVITVRGAPNRLDGRLTTGSYHLSLDYTPPPMAAIEQIAFGESRPGLIAADRPREMYVFSAQQGDVISASLVREPGASLSPVIELWDSQGRLLAQSDDGADGEVVLRDVPIPAAGAYRLAATRYLGREGRTEGRYTITLNGTPATRIIRATIGYDQPATGRLSDENTTDRYTFQGSAGDVVRIDAPALSGNLDTVAALESPAGVALAGNDDAVGVDARIEATLLPENGLYTVVVSRAAGGRTFGRAGNYQVTVTRLYQALASAATGPESGGPPMLSYGARVTGALDASASEARYAFNGAQDDEITLRLLHQNDDAPPLLSVQDPAGTVLAEGRAEGSRASLERFRLPVSGRYIVVVRRPSNATQPFTPYALTLDLASAATQDQGSATGGLLRADDSAVGSFTPAGRAQYWLFHGQHGAAVTLELVVLSGEIRPSAILIGPGGHALAVTESSGAAVRTADVILPADGYYTVLVVAGASDAAGQYRLTLHSGAAPDNSTPIEPGRVFSGLIDPATPEQRLTFQAQAGQVVSARMLVTGGDLVPWLRLVGPDGRALAEGALARDADGVSSVLSRTPLGAPGVYTLAAVSLDSGMTLTPSQGAFRLLMELDSPADAPTQDAVTARRIAYGQPARGLVQGGERALWAFIGTEGDTVNLSARAIASGAEGGALRGPVLEVQDTGGRILARALPEGGDGSETAIASLILPASGRYIVAVSAESPLSYALVVQQRETPADPATLPARALIPGSAQQNGISAETPVNYWRFNANAGDVIQIEATRIDGNARLDLALYGPRGFVKSATAGPDDPGATLRPLRLADTGSYVLVVNRWLGPAGRTNGSYRIVLSQPDDVSGSEGGLIPVYGRDVTGAITPADPSDTWTFRGAVGEVVELHITRLGGALRPTLTLYAPGAAAPLASAQGEGGEAILPRLLLPQDGEYRVVIGSLNSTSGAYTLTVRRVQTPEQASVSTAEGITPGEMVEGTLDEATPRRAWVFWGEGGTRVTMTAAPNADSSLDPFLTLIGPDGSTLFTDDNGGGGLSARLSAVLLPGDGFYGVVVSASPLHATDRPEAPGRFGAFTLHLEPGQPAAAHMGRLDVGDQVNAALDPARPSQEWTFRVTGSASGSTIAASIDSPGVAFAARLFLVTADGRLLGASGVTQDGGASVEAPLPGPGDYAVLVVAQTPAAQGDYRLTLGYALAPTGGGVLAADLGGRGSIADADFSDEWRFALADSGPVVIEAARTGGDVDLELALFGPDGALIVSQTAQGAPSVALAQDGLPPGEYRVIVSRAGGPAGATQGDYRVSLGG